MIIYRTVTRVVLKHPIHLVFYTYRKSNSNKGCIETSRYLREISSIANRTITSHNTTQPLIPPTPLQHFQPNQLDPPPHFVVH